LGAGGCARRQAGQNAPSDVDARDLKAELLQREKAHIQKQMADKAKAGLLPYAGERESSRGDRSNQTTES
jgi:hypothetical protein